MRLRRLKTYGLLNLGRDDKPGSTNRLDERILRLVKRKMPSKRWVLFFVEINEGDDNDERRLIRKVWPGARLLGATVREPILLSPDLADHVDHADVQWVKDTAVEKWSPPRSILTVVMDDGEVLKGAHFAAGANGQGDRPSWARGPLNTSWRNLDHAHDLSDRLDHQHDQHVTWMQDRNAYDRLLVPDEPGQHTVVHERTDWGKVWPAEGWRADFRALPKVDIGLDSHDLLRMRGSYTKREKAT